MTLHDRVLIDNSAVNVVNLLRIVRSTESVVTIPIRDAELINIVGINFYYPDIF